MIKTRLETLEDLHNMTQEDEIRSQIKIRNLHALKDDDVVEGFQKKGLYGDYTPATKWDVIEREKKEIRRLIIVMRTIESMIEQEKKHSTKS